MITTTKRLRKGDIVYSGTTLSNFRTCTHRNGNGEEVLFDKSREPRHNLLSLDITEDPKIAIFYAYTRAWLTTDEPCVISGRAMADNLFYVPREYDFPVDTVYIINKEILSNLPDSSELIELWGALKERGHYDEFSDMVKRICPRYGLQLFDRLSPMSIFE